LGRTERGSCPADCYAYAGLNLEEGLKYPNLISPADLHNMIAPEG